MTPEPMLSDDDLNAFADGQLSAERKAHIGAVLDRDAILAARVAEIRRQNAALRDAMDPWLAEQTPNRLLEAAAAPPRFAATSRRRWMPALASAATLIIGLGAGWLIRGEVLQYSGTPITFERQAAVTHALYAVDANRPVEIWGNEEPLLVRWLSKRLSFPVHVPNLNDVGFSLVGGRLVAGNEKPGALFMYENADKQRISLFVRRGNEPTGETAFRYSLEDGVGVFYWIEDACGYALSGNLDKNQMLAIARVVYGQLAAHEATPSKN